jgi:hypothetical protein
MNRVFQTSECATAEEFIESIRPEATPFIDSGARDWAFRGQPANEELLASVFRLEKRHLFCRTDELWLGWKNKTQISAEIEVAANFFEASDAAGLLLPDDSPQLRVRLSQFRREASSVTGGDLLREWPPRDLWSLVALMQHAGVPTRFLDWSASPYKAAYFAAKCGIERRSDIAVWAYQVSWQEQLEEYDYHHSPNRVVMVRAPYATNPTLAAQEGLHLFHQDTSADLAGPACRQPLTKTLLDLGVPQWLRKHTLPADQSQRLLWLLSKHGVTAATMFPSFEGVAKSLREADLWDFRIPTIPKLL